jgi:hypothetical protein
MLDISGSPDHSTETGVATSTTAPIKVAPIKSIFRIGESETGPAIVFCIGRSLSQIAALVTQGSACLRWLACEPSACLKAAAEMGAGGI